ncbi:hypothetical protein M0R72_09300 [Candidatus Pacearchaeota archaeon]|jgi:hypothetical protein|nr:hypothetical protein [Candidatus Pacearchaeota archaeon]
MLHAQLPWTSNQNAIDSPEGRIAITLGWFGDNGRDWKANAEFIVVACNSHDALLEACKLANAMLAHLATTGNVLEIDDWVKTQNALAKAIELVETPIQEPKNV